mgnify:CR=1 FL=1
MYVKITYKIRANDLGKCQMEREMEKEKIRQISWMIEANQWQSHKAIKIAQFYYLMDHSYIIITELLLHS